MITNASANNPNDKVTAIATTGIAAMSAAGGILPFNHNREIPVIDAIEPATFMTSIAPKRRFFSSIGCFCSVFRIRETILCKYRNGALRSEEHTSELQSPYVISYPV